MTAPSLLWRELPNAQSGASTLGIHGELLRAVPSVGNAQDVPQHEGDFISGLGPELSGLFFIGHRNSPSRPISMSGRRESNTITADNMRVSENSSFPLTSPRNGRAVSRAARKAAVSGVLTRQGVPFPDVSNGAARSGHRSDMREGGAKGPYPATDFTARRGAKARQAPAVGQLWDGAVRGAAPLLHDRWK